MLLLYKKKERDWNIEYVLFHIRFSTECHMELCIYRSCNKIGHEKNLLRKWVIDKINNDVYGL